MAAQQDQTVQDLVANLLDCAATYPNVEILREELITSLRTISLHQPNAFLKATHKYLLENSKASPSTKSFVLQSICQSVGDPVVLKSLDEQLVLLIINLVTQEITLSKDADIEFTESARDVLVALSRNPRFVANVVETVLQKFQPGASTSPHRYIVITMGNIAEHNPFGFVTFLTDILSRTIPLLPHIRTDALRCAWARAICSFFEALRECETERPKEVKEDADVNRPDSANEDYSDFQFVSNRAIYQDQAEAIYEALMHWLYSKDSRARAESAECVGQLCLVIRSQKIIEDLKKLVTTILGLYRKAVNEHHMITKGLCSFLEAACADESCPLDAYLEDILNALFPNACMDPEASTPISPTAMRNHSEAFRCFTIAASRFADRIVYFLLHKMQNISDLQKLAAINLLRHLLNSSGVFVEDNQPLIMMGLKKLLASEQPISIKVRRSVVQLCIALSDHNYVNSEGGDNVIAFLVKNLVAPTEQEIQLKKLEVDVAGTNQLRTQCAQALSTIATTCNCAAKLMWPYLLEFLCQERYNPAVGDLCKCLRILVQRETEAGRQMDFVTGFDSPLVAGQHAVLARLLTALCNAPANGLLTRRATEALGLIKLLSRWFNENIPQAIEKQVDTMEALLDELSSTTLASPSSASQPPSELRGKRIARWHEASLELLSQMLGVVVDGDWRIELASAMGKQLEMYKELPDEKAFLLRCLGTVLARITVKQFVVEHFLLMFKSTAHSSTIERQGCARGVGAVAAVHTELVLVELENVSKWEYAKKSGGFLGFIKDTMPMRQYPDAEMIYLRATLMLAYGYVVQACPVDTLSQRLQQSILPFLRHYFGNPKQETVVREAMLETMRLMGLSSSAQRVGTEWKLDARNELLSYVKDYVQSESPEMLSSSLRLLACKATSALVQLDPPLTDNDIWDLCRILTQYIIPMCREKSGLKTLAYDLFDYATSSFNTLASYSTPNNNSKSNAIRKIEDDESATIMEATVSQYGFALEQLIRSRPTIATTTMLLKILQSYYGKVAEHERSRAVDATVLVLKVYHINAGDVTIGHASDFPPLSSLLGRLSPRLTDSLAHVRMQSLTAIHWALKLAYLHKGHGQDYDPSLFSVEKFAFDHQLGGEGKLDGQVAKKVIKIISEIIESYLPQSQMQTYLSALFEMLSDRQSHVSSSAAQLLAYSLAIRGATLHNEADTLVVTLLTRLPEVHSCIQTYTDLLSALVAFAGHQQHPVCDVLLRQPLPYTTYISDAWECLSRDKWLSASVLDYLIESLTTALDNSFETIDTGAGNAVKVVYQEVCQFTAAIAEVVKNGEPESVLLERIPQLLALQLQLICSISDSQFPVVQRESADGKKLPLVITPDLRRLMDKPAGMPVAVLKNILNRTQSLAVYEDMNQARGWSECLDPENFIHALTIFIRSLAEQRPTWVPEMCSILEASAQDEREPKRLAAVVAAAAIIKKPPELNGEANEQLLVKSVKRLQDQLTDTSLRIRKLCIRGLGDLFDCPQKAVQQRFIQAAVDAAMGGLDDLGDRKDTIGMEATLALNKLVKMTKDTQLVAILAQALLKIRACFEKESPSLRAASFSLFGELGSRVGQSSEQFSSHLHNNLVALLLHLNDEQEEVRLSCAQALYQTAPLLTADIANSVITRELANGRLPHNYANFIKDFAMILSNSYPDRINQYALSCCSYFKSHSATLRCNAALLTGCLLADLSTQLRATVSKELIFSGLIALLKDPDDVKVRIIAAKAIAQLHIYAA